MLSTKLMNTLKEKFEKHMRPSLQKDLKIANIFSVPFVEKIVINTGLGRASQGATFNDKIFPEILKEFSGIVGQKPSPREAKKSIAGFKLREGQTIGLKATLRGKRMYDFMDKIIRVVLPRVRDFKGIDLKNVDKQGNLNLGFKEIVVFPEINQETSNVDFGLQITFVTKSRSREDAVEMYKKLI